MKLKNSFGGMRRTDEPLCRKCASTGVLRSGPGRPKARLGGEPARPDHTQFNEFAKQQKTQLVSKHAKSK